MVKFPYIISFLPAFEGNDFNGSGKIRRGDGYGMGLEGMYWSSTSYSLLDGGLWCIPVVLRHVDLAYTEVIVDGD
jgi:hypothetical protein